MYSCSMILRHAKNIVLNNILNSLVNIYQIKAKQILNGEYHGSILNISSSYKDLYNAKLEMISTLLIGTYITLYIPVQDIQFV